MSLRHTTSSCILGCTGKAICDRVVTLALLEADALAAACSKRLGDCAHAPCTSPINPIIKNSFLIFICLSYYHFHGSGQLSGDTVGPLSRHFYVKPTVAGEDRKSTRLNSSTPISRMPSSA